MNIAYRAPLERPVVALVREAPTPDRALELLRELPPPSLLGRMLLDRYVPQAPLEQTAFGVRYVAIDTSIGETVCLEFLPRRALGHWSSIRQAVAKLATLADPNIAAVVGRGVAGGVWPFLVTEHRAAVSLRTELGAPWDLRRVLRLGVQCAGALAAAHRAGVIHGALTPDRIALRSQGAHETILVSGFGAAALIESSPEVLLASPPALYHYSSPEQAYGRRLEARSDIYSLGVILYELVSGKPPFEGSAISVLRQHRTAAPEPPSRRCGSQELALRVFDKILARCLAKKPEERYPSAAELAADIGRLDAALTRARSPAARPARAARASGASAEPARPSPQRPRARPVETSPAHHPPQKSRVGMRPLPKVIVRGA
jgi:eukaryotic-like serine/threonine-protein kinase